MAGTVITIIPSSSKSSTSTSSLEAAVEQSLRFSVQAMSIMSSLLWDDSSLNVSLPLLKGSSFLSEDSLLKDSSSLDELSLGSQGCLGSIVVG